MLLAIGIIPVDQEKIQAPRWVILSAGLTFTLAGLVMGLIPLRHERPALYMFACSLMCTAFFLVGAWVAPFATGVKGSIGPVIVSGPAAD
jgi:lipopolysaccharide export LptBFGC system permease protein LptF